LRAVVLSELGRPADMAAAIAVARSEARRLRIAFGEVVLDGLEVPWLAMAGRFDECERLLDHIRAVGSRLSHNNVDEALTSSLFALRLWQGRPLEVVPVLEQFDATVYPFAAVVAAYLWRAGERERARSYYEEHGAPLDHAGDISLLAWAHGAELALHFDEPELAAATYALLAPYAGRCCCAGSSVATGPVDAFLAMAAAASGQMDLAARHADDALALTEAWGISLVGDWIRDQRATYGY
jgi:hypothetical protein